MTEKKIIYPLVLIIAIVAICAVAILFVTANPGYTAVNVVGYGELSIDNAGNIYNKEGNIVGEAYVPSWARDQYTEEEWLDYLCKKNRSLGMSDTGWYRANCGLIL